MAPQVPPRVCDASAAASADDSASAPRGLLHAGPVGRAVDFLPDGLRCVGFAGRLPDRSVAEERAAPPAPLGLATRLVSGAVMSWDAADVAARVTRVRGDAVATLATATESVTAAQTDMDLMRSGKATLVPDSSLVVSEERAREPLGWLIGGCPD